MDAKHDPTGITLATWVYLQHRAGVPTGVPAVVAACAAVDAEGPAAAAALHAAVRAGFEGDDFDAVARGVRALYGEGVRIGAPAGADAEARAAALRRACFGDSRPWLTTIADRRDGRLGEHLVMVEQFGETVTLMDPNPWDEVDEEHTLSAAEFLLRWELGGARAIRLA